MVMSSESHQSLSLRVKGGDGGRLDMEETSGEV